MKKLILSAIILTAAFNLSAQKEPIQQTNHHEIGIDASSFLAQILPGNGGYQNTPFFLMYRYHFPKSALRFGIGGYATKDDAITNDTASSLYQRSGLFLRVGYERKTDFGKHWQFFYGLDARFQFYNLENSNDYSQSLSLRYTQESSYYGVAPLMGFRFKINERISVTTEASFLLAFYTEENRYEWTPEEEPYRTNEFQKREGYTAEFRQPINIIFTYNF